MSKLDSFYSSPDIRSAYVSNHPALSPEIKQAVVEGRIIPGMDTATIEDLFGPPEKTYISESGLMQVWFYDNSKFAFGFDNKGKLIKVLEPEGIKPVNNK
jgi:hypothetical protein